MTEKNMEKPSLNSINFHKLVSEINIINFKINLFEFNQFP